MSHACPCTWCCCPAGPPTLLLMPLQQHGRCCMLPGAAPAQGGPPCMHGEMSALCCHRGTALCHELHATGDGRQRMICSPRHRACCSASDDSMLARSTSGGGCCRALGSHAARGEVWARPNLRRGKIRALHSSNAQCCNAFRHAVDASQQVTLMALVVCSLPPAHLAPQQPPQHTASAFAACTANPSAVLYTAAYTQAHAAAYFLRCRTCCSPPSYLLHDSPLHQPSCMHPPSLL